LELELFVVERLCVGLALFRDVAELPDVDWQGLLVVLHKLGEREQRLRKNPTSSVRGKTRILTVECDSWNE